MWDKKIKGTVLYKPIAIETGDPIIDVSRTNRSCDRRQQEIRRIKDSYDTTMQLTNEQKSDYL